MLVTAVGCRALLARPDTGRGIEGRDPVRHAPGYLFIVIIGALNGASPRIASAHAQ